LTKVYTSDTSADGNATDGIIAAGDDITFTITVHNQGTVDAANIEITDYIPTGLELASNTTWTGNTDGTAATTIAAIPAGESVDVDITLVADDPTLGDHTNTAEISNDNGTDIDSTPNADINTDGDEDDHDGAILTLTPDGPLALTGSNWTYVLFSWAFGLFLLGAALVLFARKEEDEDIAV